jgi:hypothetical protein
MKTAFLLLLSILLPSGAALATCTEAAGSRAQLLTIAGAGACAPRYACQYKAECTGGSPGQVVICPANMPATERDPVSCPSFADCVRGGSVSRPEDMARDAAARPATLANGRPNPAYRPFTFAESIAENSERLTFNCGSEIPPALLYLPSAHGCEAVSICGYEGQCVATITSNPYKRMAAHAPLHTACRAVAGACSGLASCAAQREVRTAAARAFAPPTPPSLSSGAAAPVSRTPVRPRSAPAAKKAD